LPTPRRSKRLEAILHPLIRAESERRIAGAASPYVILMVPLLVESGSYRERVTGSPWSTARGDPDCPRHEPQRPARAEVERILAAQATRAERLAAADDVIDNDGDSPTCRPGSNACMGNIWHLARQFG
jgi:dephospho-CoA kinase